MSEEQVLFKIISQRLNLAEEQVVHVIQLLDEGATIPFIARYRKERTGGMKDFQIEALNDLYTQLKAIEKRKERIISSIDEQGKLTADLKTQLRDCFNLQELEDIYLPYKSKRQTRAEIARKKGLDPLAKKIFKQQDVVLTESEESLQGARDIIAEMINEHPVARDIVRKNYHRTAVISSKIIKGKEVEGLKYKDYYKHEELLNKISSHRLLAILRGEKEGFLRVKLTPNEEELERNLLSYFVKSNSFVSKQLIIAIQDAYKRLLKPAIDNEFLNSSKAKADEEAIHVFSENLKQLLLSPPLGQKRILSIDPGYRTGCKVVCLDQQGDLLHNETVYIHPPTGSFKLAAKKISTLVEAYKIEAIAIGNGTAGRDTEHFIKNLSFRNALQIFSVSENGASIYSASAVAREEFPNYDITVRGAVSIGRRLMDPLAELVKIDPKSIGVGQYQHDVDQSKMKLALDRIVQSCVNSVGVNLNVAGKYILMHISGLGPQLAQNIVNYRKENGVFNNRLELMNVPRMGEKAFEQCAGFLRVSNSSNPLDNTAVHPESYAVLQKIITTLNCNIEELIASKELQQRINVQDYVSEKVGLPTLQLILEELAKPGRDPRSKIEYFEFDSQIQTIADLYVGQVLSGVVTNITKFGAFIDLGVKEKGLVHISNLANRFVSDPMDILSLNQQVRVKIIELDQDRKRIQLSMKDVNC